MSQAPPRGRPASVAGTPREGRSPWRTRRQCQQGAGPYGGGARCAPWCRDIAIASSTGALGAETTQHTVSPQHWAQPAF